MATPEPSVYTRWSNLAVTCAEHRRGSLRPGEPFLVGVRNFVAEPGPDGSDGVIWFETPRIEQAERFLVGSIWTITAQFFRGQVVARVDSYERYEVSFNRASLVDSNSATWIKIALRPQRKPMLWPPSSSPSR